MRLRRASSGRVDARGRRLLRSLDATDDARRAWLPRCSAWSRLLLGARLTHAADIFPLDDVRPGMVGVGRTVFEGSRIDEFKVTVLGVLDNAIGPKQSLIIARFEGGPLEKTGVIAGMSGSPVFIDGKLLGRGLLRLSLLQGDDRRDHSHREHDPGHRHRRAPGRPRRASLPRSGQEASPSP